MGGFVQETHESHQKGDREAWAGISTCKNMEELQENLDEKETYNHQENLAHNSTLTEASTNTTTAQYRHTLFYRASQILRFLLYKLKVASSKSINTIFPRTFAHFVTVSHFSNF